MTDLKVLHIDGTATYLGYPLGLSRRDFPLKSGPLRRVVATVHERCPECGGFLDTGNECNDCGFDAAPEVDEPRYEP